MWKQKYQFFQCELVFIGVTEVIKSLTPHPKASQVIKSLEQCPREVCILQRESINTFWIQCNCCNQWYHQWCLKISRKRAETKAFICKYCNQN